MSKIADCAKCGSSKMIEGARVLGGAHQEPVKVEVHKKPHAKLFKGAVHVSLVAHVCSACGYTELYAEDPDQLLEAQKASR